MSPTGHGRRLRSAAAVPLAALLLASTSCAVLSGAAPTPGAASSGGAPVTSAPSASAVPSSAMSSPGTPSAGASSDPTPEGGCAALVQRLSLAERVGQLLMVAVPSTGLSADDAAVIRETHAGSVILLGNTRAGLTSVQDVVGAVREAADRPQRVSVLLAADQEGGLVQRLAGVGFSDIPSAVQQAKLSDAELADDAQVWGDQLDKAGINANLAPVADVVPASLASVNEPIAQLRRGYGSSPRLVARKVEAFVTGMNDAGTATAVKHFPGLGRVRGNTDTAARVVDTTTVRRDAGLAGFRAAVAADVDMVMVSSAVYTRIDGRRPAVFSSAVVTDMIRGDLGFDGVVISDDLAAVALQGFPADRRAVGFVRAGGDLAIVGDPGEARTMATALVDRATADADFAAQVDQSAARVLAMKDRRGLAGC